MTAADVKYDDKRWRPQGTSLSSDGITQSPAVSTFSLSLLLWLWLSLSLLSKRYVWRTNILLIDNVPFHKLSSSWQGYLGICIYLSCIQQISIQNHKMNNKIIAHQMHFYWYYFCCSVFIFIDLIMRLRNVHIWDMRRWMNITTIEISSLFTLSLCSSFHQIYHLWRGTASLRWWLLLLSFHTWFLYSNEVGMGRRHHSLLRHQMCLLSMRLFVT